MGERKAKGMETKKICVSIVGAGSDPALPYSSAEAIM